MKIPSHATWMALFLLVPCLGLSQLPPLPEENPDIPPPEIITLMGSNGKEVKFAGLKDATPKGLTAKVSARSDIIGVKWEQLDLDHLQRFYPNVHAAYLQTQQGATINLNLGVFEDPEMRKRRLDYANKKQIDGWYETSVRGIKFAIQTPIGEPRGVLFVGLGEEGKSYRYLLGIERGQGKYGKFLTESRFALMTYEFELPSSFDYKELPPFALAEKGTGESMLLALEQLAQATSLPSLTEVPIVMYGADKVGASFAYHFTQWKPERVLATVLDKGCFYNAPPTEESAKVPTLFIWGQYDNTSERFNSEWNHDNAFDRGRAMNALWTSAMEYRGRRGDSPSSTYIWQEYLKKVIDARIKEVQPPTPEAKEGEPPPPKPKPKFEIQPYDESQGYVGNLETFEYAPHKKGEPIKEGETWLPNRDFAQEWKKFGLGELPFPGPL